MGLAGNDSNGSALQKAHHWALDLGAITFLLNHPPDVLVGDIQFHQLKSYLTLFTESVIREDLLEAWWSISKHTLEQSHNESIQTLNWLLFQGHRVHFLTQDSNYVGDEKDWLAWDMGRVSALAQMCCSAGYISETEAWEYISTASLIIQPHFNSWTQFAQAYIEGKRHWRDSDIQATQNKIEQLLNDPTSPWRSIEWGTSLAPLTKYLILPDAILPDANNPQLELTPEVQAFIPGAKTYFFIVEHLRRVALQFDFISVRPFAYYQRTQVPGVVKRLAIVPQKMEANANPVLKFKVFGGMRFDKVEKFLFPNSRQDGAAPTFSQYAEIMAYDYKEQHLAIQSLAELPQLLQAVSSEIEGIVLPTLANNSKLGEILVNLEGGHSEQLCQWRGFEREIIVAAAELFVDEKAKAVTRFKKAGEEWPDYKTWTDFYIEQAEKTIPLKVTDTPEAESPEVVQTVKDLKSDEKIKASMAAEKVMQKHTDFSTQDFYCIVPVLIESGKNLEAATWYFIAEVRARCAFAFSDDRDQKNEIIRSTRDEVTPVFYLKFESTPDVLAKGIQQAVLWTQQNPDINKGFDIDDLDWTRICLQAQYGLLGLAKFYETVNIEAWHVYLQKKYKAPI